MQIALELRPNVLGGVLALYPFLRFTAKAPFTTFKFDVFVGRCVGMSGNAIDVMLSTLNVLFAIGAWYTGGIARGSRPTHNTSTASRPVTGGGGTLNLGAEKASGEHGRCEGTVGGEEGGARTGAIGFMIMEGVGIALSLHLTISSQPHFIWTVSELRSS